MHIVYRKSHMFVSFLFFLLSCIFTVNKALATSSESQTGETPVNILWIYIDDMNDWMSIYGDDTVSTPNIDSLAKSGVRFDSAIMPAPVCSSTRSAIITGTMQTTVGVHQHSTARSEKAPVYLPKGHKTIPELFRDSGYETFNIGKDDYNFTYDRNELYSINPVPERSKQKKNKKGKLQTNKLKKGASFDLATLPKDKPFFGQIQLMGGKNKKQPPVTINPKDMLAKLPPYYPADDVFLNELANHYQTIAITDIEVGEIVDQLKAMGRYDNTVIFFFSDHGMRLMRHKQFVYEGGIKVPLVVSWEGQSDKLTTLGKTRPDLVSGVDIGTSSLALANIDIPQYMSGDDIFAADYQGKDFVISARDRCDYSPDRIRAVRSERFKYIKNFMPEVPYMQPQYRDLHPKLLPFMPVYRSLLAENKLTPTQALFGASTRPVEELYDLENDPHEINNLATNPKYQQILLTHRARLEKWIANTDDKGQYPEDVNSIKYMLKRWPQCKNSEYCQAYAQSILGAN